MVDNLHYKVKKYLEANSKTESELYSNKIELQDDGSGGYIETWNVDGLAKPNDSQLNALASNATKDLNNAVIRKTRKTGYGTIGDQLDLLYKEGIVAHIQIHDELCLSIENDAQAKKIVEIMEQAVTLEVPNKVDYEHGINWGSIND